MDIPSYSKLLEEATLTEDEVDTMKQQISAKLLEGVEQNNGKKEVIMISGIPGAGKSTLSKNKELVLSLFEGMQSADTFIVIDSDEWVYFHPRWDELKNQFIEARNTIWAEIKRKEIDVLSELFDTSKYNYIISNPGIHINLMLYELSNNAALNQILVVTNLKDSIKRAKLRVGIEGYKFHPDKIEEDIEENWEDFKNITPYLSQLADTVVVVENLDNFEMLEKYNPGDFSVKELAGKMKELMSKYD